MKRMISVLILFALCLTLCACGGGKEQIAEFNSPVTMGDFEVIVSDDILTAEQLNFDSSWYDEFLTTDMSVGRTVTVAKDGNVLAVISYTIENTSKESSTFSLEAKLDYDNGYEYYSSEQYWTTGDSIDSWHQFSVDDFTNLDLQPLGGTIYCKAYWAIPAEVFENTDAPLILSIGSTQFTIR